MYLTALYMTLFGCALFWVLECITLQETEHPPLPELCKMQCDKNINASYTADYCNSSKGLEMHGRCCLNVTEWILYNKTTVLGMDLQQCHLNEQHFSTGIENITSLQIISIEGNPMKNISITDFHRNIGIVYLSLPGDLTCPGNPDLWSNETHTDNATICLEELNPCQILNVSCPDHSHCVHSGVDQTECLCDVGYHGYKCMNQGAFPTLPFVIGIAIPTVMLCLILWITQRRYVISEKKK